MDTNVIRGAPRFVVFEGVDGTGKTALASMLAQHYGKLGLSTPLYADSFPGSRAGTLGEWVYRLHHSRDADGLGPRDIAPAALQLLHVAAHVDMVLTSIAPTFAQGGSVILDRYWWSTYAYSRMHLPPHQVWPLINAERVFWQGLPHPTVIYLTRRASLKAQEVDTATHTQLGAYYEEVIAHERGQGIQVCEVSNDGSLEQAWDTLLRVLGLSTQLS